MLKFLTNRSQHCTTSVCFCTLAIREPYRVRAQRLFESAPGLAVRAVHHEPTGLMAFFDAWARSAEFLHSKDTFTGEGGVIGLAAFCAGWTVDYKNSNPWPSLQKKEFPAKTQRRFQCSLCAFA